MKLSLTPNAVIVLQKDTSKRPIRRGSGNPGRDNPKGGEERRLGRETLQKGVDAKKTEGNFSAS